MQRVGRRAKLRPNCARGYDRWHDQVWPSVLQALQAAGIRNYTIFRYGDELFSYFEVDNLDSAIAKLAADPECQRWQDSLAPLMNAENPLDPWTVITEVFHLD